METEGRPKAPHAPVVMKAPHTPTGPNRTEAGVPEQHEREAGVPLPHAGEGDEAELDAREAGLVVTMALEAGEPEQHVQGDEEAREGDEPVQEAALIVPAVPGQQMAPEECPGFDRNNH